MRIAGIVRFRPSDMSSIDKVIAYIQANYSRTITAAELADRFNITLPKLHAGIKKKTGHTLHDFISEARIDAAKKLLEELEHSVKLIAGIVGYKNSSYFVQVFKDRTGITPMRYRFQISA